MTDGQMAGDGRRAGWLPAGFEHPRRIDLECGAHLRTIRGDDVEIDFPAVMGSRERLWEKYGEAWGWPPSTMTFEQDRQDLVRHEHEIAAHESFNYAVLSMSESELLGCVYLDPPEEEPDCDVIVSWWVIDACVGEPIDRELSRFVPEWITTAWPFRQPRFAP